MTKDKTNLLALDRAGLEAFFVAMGEKPFRANQVFKWIYQGLVTDFDQMNNISKSLRERLSQLATIQVPKIEVEQIAEDGTRKWLMRLHDGNAIEVVLIPEEDRSTLCISSQVGCSLNCTFCATARQGFNRNLGTDEIIGQLWQAWRVISQDPQYIEKTASQDQPSRPISNVVLMGMGEPLMNFDAVTSAVRIMLDDFAFGLSRRRVTLSTAGMVPAMARLSETLPISLAVSLHAPDDALRDQLVPLNKKYPIRVLLDACKDYVKDRAKDRITFEYLMLDGINDSDAQAQSLANLLKDVPSKINLIPFNPVQGVPYKRSSRNRVNAFRDILMKNGLVAVTRKTRGDDIDAACGQLVGKVDDRTKRSMRLSQAVQVPATL